MLTNWTDPLVIVGGAQVLAALALVWFTVSLSKSTDKYAKITERDLELKEKIRQIERLHKELDNIIGPIYSKLGYQSKLPDQNYFNNRVVWGTQPGFDSTSKVDCKASVFWSDIKKNLYLTIPETRKKITAYLEIKAGTNRWLGETDSGYKKDLENMTDAVVDRYEKLTKELDELGNGK